MSRPARPLDRPLSPHLGIYRFQWTMALSILHRLTGVALGAGLVLLTWWLVAAADFFHQIGPKQLGQVDWAGALRKLILGFFLKMVVADNLREATAALRSPMFELLPKVNLVALLVVTPVVELSHSTCDPLMKFVPVTVNVTSVACPAVALVGLMALMYYSHRHGYDDRVQEIKRNEP